VGGRVGERDGTDFKRTHYQMSRFMPNAIWSNYFSILSNSSQA